VYLSVDMNSDAEADDIVDEIKSMR
jgi:hypothetical protein